MRIYFIFNEMRMSKFLFIFNVNSGMKQGGGGKRRGLGPRNDVLTTCKAVTQRGGQRIITVFFPQ